MIVVALLYGFKIDNKWQRGVCFRKESAEEQLGPLPAGSSHAQTPRITVHALLLERMVAFYTAMQFSLHADGLIRHRLESTMVQHCKRR